MIHPPLPAPLRRTAALLAGCLALLVSSTTAVAAELLADDFAYPAGPLVSSANPWRNQRGVAGITVEEGRAVIAGEAAGETFVARPFEPAPAVEADFTLRFDPLAEGAASAGVFFQFTSADGRARRGRVALEVGADGTARLGVSAKASNQITWAEPRLAPAEDHRVRLRYDGRTGKTSLWINPGPGATPPAAENVDADAVVPARVSFQQSAKPGAPTLRLAGLRVRTADAEGTPSGDAAAARAMLPPSPWAGEPEATPPPAERFYVFLLIGQSNMAGRGVPEESDRAADPRILARLDDGRWVVAREPLHWDKPHAAGVGPGLAFARALLPDLPADASIGLVPAAWGGTSVAWWQKNYDGDQRRDDGVTFYRHTIEAARAAATRGTLAGVLWNQGESDAGRARSDEGAAYLRQLEALIRDLRADLGQPELPFVAATLGPWRAENAREFNAAVRRLPVLVPRTATVDTLAPELAGRLRNKRNDPPHYDTESARLLGELYAREMRVLLAGGE